ncbi:integral membrane protein Pth11-like protein [Aspergillus heteromorphus CBS 117.55]|uniref:Integral membrane protein Pth11-like protein n=1 Tax=Aspergillus heteromorphus CBS 117.55 TaxID=1448321 RepID=A0A317VF08_9EURO|nr:integral membrane protein Pth11-like protein [Aspergillus heteromorphus CBS 117.55]PWY72954.1 integral membrane protein Pth11-like protein [Aspergillus heteromorphus CBS 117.55]
MSKSQGPVVAGVAVAFAALTFVVICLRLFARVYVLKRMGLDDFLIIGACFLSWAFTTVTVVAVHHGMGKHLVDVDENGLMTYSFAVWLSSMFYLACLGFVKTSVCWFYTRLGDKHLTRAAIVMMCVVGAQATSFVLTAAFQCQPIAKAWDTSIPGKCVTINVFYLCNAALNILTDLVTYSLPIRVILRLHMPLKQKLALGGILCLGLFACISSIIRITYIPSMLTSADYTYAISGAMYWSAIEINVGILASSIPSFKAIASRFLPRLIGEYSADKGYNWSSSNNNNNNNSNNQNKRYGSGFSKVREHTFGMSILNTRGEEETVTDTHIGRNTSEERIIIPEGKIFAHTEIETNVEVSPDYVVETVPSFERERSR